MFSLNSRKLFTNWHLSIPYPLCVRRSNFPTFLFVIVAVVSCQCNMFRSPYIELDMTTLLHLHTTLQGLKQPQSLHLFPLFVQQCAPKWEYGILNCSRLKLDVPGLGHYAPAAVRAHPPAVSSNTPANSAHVSLPHFICHAPNRTAMRWYGRSVSGAASH